MIKLADSWQISIGCFYRVNGRTLIICSILGNILARHGHEPIEHDKENEDSGVHNECRALLAVERNSLARI
jgi:hypothetical protein